MARSDPRAADVERLAEAYERYDADPGARRRWALANPGNRAIHAERSARVGAALAALPAPGALLDLGCGRGGSLAELTGPTAAGLRIGVDLRAARLEAAAGRLPGASFLRAEGSALPFADGAFGVALAFTLFSSVLDAGLAHAIAEELRRVLRPGGVLVWYDLRRANPRNPQVRPWSRSEIAALFPGWAATLDPVTVLPPLARRLGPATGAVYPWLARVRPLTTHLVGVLARPG